MSLLPSGRASRTICFPSGDQRAAPAWPPKLVSCTWFCPSLSQTQTSVPPVRSEAKAILLPSGEYLGEPSPRVEAISLVGTALLSVALGPGARQILASVLPW